MSKIIAYTWESGVHCVSCTQGRMFNHYYNFSGARAIDENGVRCDCYGNDGARVRPVFSTDEQPYAGLYCDTCCDEIVAPTPERFQA